MLCQSSLLPISYIENNIDKYGPDNETFRHIENKQSQKRRYKTHSHSILVIPLSRIMITRRFITFAYPNILFTYKYVIIPSRVFKFPRYMTCNFTLMSLGIIAQHLADTFASSPNWLTMAHMTRSAILLLSSKWDQGLHMFVTCVARVVTSRLKDLLFCSLTCSRPKIEHVRLLRGSARSPSFVYFKLTENSINICMS